MLRLLFVFACVATLLVAIYVEEGWRGRRAWAAYQAASIHRGTKLVLEDYLSADIPDAQNFAALPVFQEPFIAAQNGKPAPQTFAFPTVKDPRPNTADLLKTQRIDLAAWRDFFVKAKLLDAPGPDAARDVLRALEHYKPALEQVHEAGTRPFSRFPVKWSDGFSALLPHLPTFQQATALVALRMSAHLAANESEAAYADFSDGLNLYQGLRNEPVVLCGLVRISMINRLINGVWDGLAGHQWAEPQLRALQTDLRALNLMEDYSFSLGSERGGLNSTLGALSDRGMSGLIELVAISVDGKPQAASAALFTGIYPRGWWLQNQVLINQLFDQSLDRLDPRTGVVQPDAGQKIEFDRMCGSSLWRRIYYAPTNLLLPAYEPIAANYFAAHTRVGQTDIACALERFHRAKSSFPQRLEELIPDFIPSIPRDVMDGAPMRYHRTPTGSFELWSIAINRRDDSAMVAPERDVRSQPDWVWRYPAAVNVALWK
ncbi:MAG: hypothetical protein JWL59_3902 [Chthoniobacteraceae bacterium]|nr:hypothetical protein [Chthoniobacteraceae bacterium]